MAVITHALPGFSGTVVIACREYVFTDGVARAEVNETERVVIGVHGHHVASEPAPPAPRPKRRKVAEPGPEIGQPVEVTEEAPPEIG